MSNLGKFFSTAAVRIFKGFVLEKDIDPLTIDHSSIKKIIIVVRHQMGDMLCSIPMMRSIRDFYPEAHITLVTKNSTNFSSIFNENNSPVDEVKNYEYGFESFLNIAKELKDKKPDLAIVPSPVVFSATNHMFAYYSDSKYRAGVRSNDYTPNMTSYVLNIKKDFQWGLKKVHQIERNLDVIRQLNIDPLHSSIRLSINHESNEFAERYIAENFPDRSRPIIGFHPGAGKEQNIWSPENYSHLIRKLKAELNPYFFISNGPADGKYIAELSALLGEEVDFKISEKTTELMQTAAIISKTTLFVSNDTGIMHLASGLDIPQIGLFGPTKAWEWGIIGSKKMSIQSGSENINNISIQKVFETSMALLSV